MNPSQFFFDQTNTLRSGWRFAVFALVFVLSGSLVGVLTLGLILALSQPGEPGVFVLLSVNGVVSAALALLAGWLCARYLERLPFRSLGAAFTGGWLRNLAAGFLIGGVTFAAAALIGMLAGGLTFRPNLEAGVPAIAYTLSLSLVLFTAAAAFEEALLRGYMLQTFLRSDLAAFAVLFTSAVFATLHNSNPNATLLSWLNTFLAGIWLALAYLKTRDLWMPLGVHVAWNWVQGSIFGIEVSGLTDIVAAPVMRETDAGPAWLTGGEYGIEGGIACTAALVLSSAAIYFLPFPRPDSELLAMTSPRSASDVMKDQV